MHRVGRIEYAPGKSFLYQQACKIKTGTRTNSNVAAAAKISDCSNYYCGVYSTMAELPYLNNT